MSEREEHAALVEKAKKVQSSYWKEDGTLFTDQTVVPGLLKRLEELEAKLRKSALQEMSALGQASEAYQAQLAAEAKLAKAVEAMQFWSEAVEPDVDKAITLMASTLAELKGQGDA
jgi:hypothetical protein